jgi:hypothetical protein
MIARQFKRVLRHVPGARALDRYLCHRYTGTYEPEPYPRGHHYSPLADISEVESRAALLFRKEVDLGPSINLQPKAQKQLLGEVARYYSDFNWPKQPSREFRFHLGQTAFGPGDAVILHAILRYFRPKRVIEAGSGFTSALMLDTDERFFQNQIDFTFVEPYPESLLSLLHPNDLGRCTLVRDKLQNVPLTVFHRLEANDLLFIDSSHVSKIGSDVNFILFEILPALRPGVLIHFHDILWPFEYSLRWIKEGKAWNEAYMVRAFLQYNSHFEIILMNSFAGHAMRSLVEATMPLCLEDPGGSLWLRKVA